MTDHELTRLLFLDDGPGPGDLALVLGSSDPETSRRRARHAVGLYHAGLVPRLLLSGGGARAGTPASEAGLMLRVASDLGVPRDAVLVEDRSRTTVENVVNSVALLADRALLGGARTVLLVSCAWHMRRALLVARAGFPGHVRLRCCPHSESCTARSWPRSRECRAKVVAEAELLLSLIEAVAPIGPSA